MSSHATHGDARHSPPEPTTVRFKEENVRAETVAGRICRAVAAALLDSPVPRPEIARLMSEFCDKDVSLDMLNAYASQARESHVINVVRFMALLHATRDRRLLELIAERFGWSVIERRLLPAIEFGQVRNQPEEDSGSTSSQPGAPPSIYELLNLLSTKMHGAMLTLKGAGILTMDGMEDGSEGGARALFEILNELVELSMFRLREATDVTDQLYAISGVH